MTTGRQDPRYQSALLAVEEADAALTGINPASGAHLQAGYPGLAKALAQVSSGATQAKASAVSLAASATQLQSAVGRLRAGEGALAGGLGRLEAGNLREAATLAALSQRTAQSEPGLTRLLDGEQQLSGGTAQLAAAAGQLETALSSEPAQLSPLTTGLAKPAARSRGDQADLRVRRPEPADPPVARSVRIGRPAAGGAGRRPGRDPPRRPSR